MADTLPKQWLVVRMTHLGDVVLTTGVISHFAETRGWSFHYLTKQGNAQALNGHPDIKRLILPGDDSLDGAAWVSACRNLAKEYKGWGLLDLHGTLRSRVLSLLWKGPVRRYPKFTVARRFYKTFHAQWAQNKLEEYNVPQRYALAVDEHAPAPELVMPRIHLSDEERLKGQKLIDIMDASGPVAVIHPYATNPGKLWPNGHWEELVSLMLDMGWNIAIIGRSETPFYGDEAPEGVTDYTNETNIRETCGLIAEANVLITNDSGPMHLGTAVGTRVIALFGPTTRAWGFYPSGPHDIALEADLSCRPCSLHGKGECSRDQQCMADITPKLVAQTLTGK